MKMNEMTKKKRIVIASVVASLYQGFFYFVESLSLNYRVMHTKLDDLIPFNEFFIIPYGIWFLFVGLTVINVIFRAGDDYFVKFLYLLFGAMTFCLIINILFPSMVDLRPKTYLRDNIFVDMVKFMHKIDTPTNVCPSIHAYAQVVCNQVYLKHLVGEKEKAKKIIAKITTVLVLMSTVILKQHSVIDLVVGTLLGLVVFQIFNKYIFNKKQILR